MRILVAEDERFLADLVAEGLRKRTMAVDVAYDGAGALERLSVNEYDVLVLDRDLPLVHGDEICRELAQREEAVRILMLTASGAVHERVDGLNLGADDYLAKPFAFEELLARLRAVIRRRYREPSSVVRVADLEIDLAARAVRRAGSAVTLSAREYSLLEYLAMRRGQVVTRAEIHDHVYDLAAEPGSNVVDVYVGYLRRKIDEGHAVKLIRTHRGLGYSLGGDA